MRKGASSSTAPAAQGPRLVRAEKGGVNYFKMITPGSTSVDLSVYDAAASVEGISGSADVVRMQTEGSSIQAVELFAIKNDSNPPRTLASPATFEFVLPDGAQIEGADAQAPNGQPISATAKPAKEKNHYAFSFALKPGETRFAGCLSFSLQRQGVVFSAPHAQFRTLRAGPSLQHEVFSQGCEAVPGDGQPAGQQRAGQPSSAGRSGFELRHLRHGHDPGRAGQGSAERSAGRRSHGRQATTTAAPAADSAGRSMRQTVWPNIAGTFSERCSRILVGGGIWTHERTKQEEADQAVPLSAAALQSCSGQRAVAHRQRRPIRHNRPRAIFCSPR